MSLGFVALDPDHLEGLARQVHDETGIESPIDMFVLAPLCGFDLIPSRSPMASINVRRMQIRYPFGVRDPRQHGQIGHELGHYVWYVDCKCDPNTLVGETAEAAASYIGGALLLPRRRFERDLALTNGDLFDVRARHPNASYQALAIRMCQVKHATSVTIWDGGKLHRSYGSGDPLEDRDLAARVLSTEEPIRGDVSAWPVISPRTLSSPEFRRALVVRRAA